VVDSPQSDATGAGSEVPDAAAAPDAQGGGEWYVSSGRPEALRWLAEDFPRNFAPAASALLRCDVSVRLTGVAAAAEADFARTVEQPSCCFCLRADGEEGEPGGQVRVELSQPAAAAMAQLLLGGPAGGEEPARPLTAVERRVLCRLVELAGVSLSSVWPVGARPRLRPCEDEPRPPGGQGAGGRRRGAVATFELTLAGRAGALRICVLGAQARGLLPPPARARHVPLELTAAVEDTAIDASDLAAASPGDVLVTDTALDGEVTVRLGGIPKFAARLCDADGHRALKLTRRLVARTARAAATKHP